MDGMTADWAHLPYDFLANISNEIINNVKGINRVVYDINNKPPATIEWGRYRIKNENLKLVMKKWLMGNSVFGCNGFGFTPSGRPG